MATRRHWVLALPVLSLILGTAAAIAEEKEKDAYDILEELRQKHRAEEKRKKDEFVREKNRKIQEGTAELDRAKDEEVKGMLRSVTVTVDDKDVTSKEPTTTAEAISRPEINDEWELHPDDYDILVHEIWKLKKEDFRHMKPTEVTLDLAYLPDPTYFIVPFTVTNSDHAPRNISPRLWVVTSDLRFTPEVGGLIVEQATERSMLREFENLPTLAGIAIRNASGTLEPRGYFAAGQTRYGIAIFKRFDQEMDDMKIVVDGLDNDMKYAKNLRRALVLHFARRGDEFYPQRESLAFKGKDFEYVWNWYQGITIQKPSKMTIETPTKKREKDMWYYKYELANRTGKPQDISLRRFDSVVTVKVNLAVNRKVSRLDAESGRTIEKAVDREFNGDVEVNLVDDGKSTIHRAQVMREIGAEFRADRFFKGTLKPGKTVEGLVVFDQTDVDFGPIYTYIESRLNAQGFESTLEDPQTIEDFFVKVRPPLIKLTEEEKNSIRDQVIAAVPDALDDLRGDKRIIADVTARAGIASGTFRIRRTYFQRGKIEEFWINKWEVY